MDVDTLPCGGCKFCRRAQEQWSTFEDEIDYLTLLSIHQLDTQEIDTQWVSKILVTNEEISDHQKNDPNINQLMLWRKKDYEPSREELKSSSPAVRYFWQCRSQLLFRRGILYYKWDDPVCPKLLLVTPNSMQQEILENCHNKKLAGHLGQNKTLAKLRKYAIWHHMSEDCRLFVQQCTVCSMNKKAPRKARAELGQYLSGLPMGRVHVDLKGPLPTTKQKNKYILMIVDQLTKWLECLPLPNQNAETVAIALVDRFIARFGCPLEIHTDQGRNVDGNLMRSLCDLLQISKTRTTPYHPASNGQVERANRTVLQAIRCFLKKKQSEWDVNLQQLTGAIRETENRQTGFTPIS